jgi:hypothetical protein
LLGGKDSVVVEDLNARFDSLPFGFWDKSPWRALLLPLTARARVLADVMAGAEYGLSLRTSLERVGEARRAEKRKKIPSTLSANDFPV